MEYKLFAVRVFVSDWERALRFYTETLGTWSDTPATHRMLAERGVEFLSPPERQSWGGTLANFRDPDGNVLTLLGSN